jgi:hypothetical protein
LVAGGRTPRWVRFVATRRQTEIGLSPGNLSPGEDRLSKLDGVVVKFELGGSTVADPAPITRFRIDGDPGEGDDLLVE